MFDWVIYRPPKIFKFQSEAKFEQIITIVTTRSVFLFTFILTKKTSLKRSRNSTLNSKLPTNRANTNCRPFQVKINCSKLIADAYQQCTTLLVFLFLTSINPVVWCISAKKN